MTTRILVLLTIVVLAGCNNADNESTAQPSNKTTKSTTLEQGKKLFYTKCASCHFVNKDMTGPALKGVEQRWPDTTKLYAFIRNSEAVINTDKYARELWLQYNQTMMNKHEDLTDLDIRSILDYIQSVSE